MCGITGIFDTRGQKPPDRDILRRMNDSQHHRGPDEGGDYFAPGVALGHRRLSIIDLSSGQQPLFNEDHTVAVAYNGEIYNYPALQSQLEGLGHRFRTRCDTEVIVHAWEEWGPDCVRRFRGMFAFAIWDANSETLFLARDRLGIKPLYYSLLADGTLLFGSELKSLQCYPGFPRQFDLRAVEDYFAYGYIPDPRTLFAGVHKLPPAHWIRFDRGRAGEAKPRQYWHLTFRHEKPVTSIDAGAELIERLREAVQLRMVAEVPLGAFLSGGVDSSAVVAMMAGLSSEPVNTCSIGFADQAFDESRYAGQVAEKYGAHHNVRQVNPQSFDLVDRLAGMYDEPFADSSAMPTYRVCNLARETVTVALSGDGGDELFAGYRRHRWHYYEQQVRRRVPEFLRGPLFGTLGRIYPKMDWGPRKLRAKSTFQSLALDAVDGYFNSVSIMDDGSRQRLFSGAMKGALQGYSARQVLQRHMRDAPVDDELSRIQYADFMTYLPGDILTKVDRASMANSLEVRVPILDHEFVEWASGISAGLRLRGRQGKYLFKKALEPYLPADILYRDKMGFAVPISAWFRGPLKARLKTALTSDYLRDSGIFDNAVLDDMIAQHQAGRRDYGSPLWALLMFESCVRQTNGTASGAGAPFRLSA